VLERQSVRRSKYNSFPVIIFVRLLVVQSSNMGPSNITEVDIFGKRQVIAGGEK
jgi:hypothetical protein